jgi:hypothetical protein
VHAARSFWQLDLVTPRVSIETAIFDQIQAARAPELRSLRLQIARDSTRIR